MADQGKAIFNPVRRGHRLLVIVPNQHRGGW